MISGFPLYPRLLKCFFFKDSQRARYIFSVKKCCTFGSFIIDTPPHDFRQYCTLASHLILVDIKTSVSKSFSNTVALKKKNKKNKQKKPQSHYHSMMRHHHSKTTHGPQIISTKK